MTPTARSLRVLLGTLLSLLASRESIQAVPPGNIFFDAREQGEVVYSHSRHVRLGLKCTDCHARIFKKVHTALPGGMSAITRGSSCGTCHNGRRAFSANNCAACHKRKLGQNPPRLLVPKGGGTVHLGDVTFKHAAHLDRGLRCYACHPSPFKMQAGATRINMEGMSRGATCGKCHNGRTAFATTGGRCGSCHSYPVAMAGKPIHFRGVTFEHSTHTRRFSCNACHQKRTATNFTMRANADKITMARINKGERCGVCHNGKKAFGPGDCTRCHVGMPAPAQDITFPEKAVGMVTFSHSYHVGKKLHCKECHTDAFKAKAHTTTVTMELINDGKKCGKCHNQKRAFGAGACDRCHQDAQGPADITLQEASLGNVTFSHRNHAGMGVKCAECHSGVFKAKRGANKITMDNINAGKQCGACHNGKRAFDPSAH